ncbi:MAG: HNH nuclease [Parcubacteria group bacterium GW2011_GWC2_39_14]|nr:MAG: HNH nuclease [Parcubacteria group bacterium GW2011_GWC2_39_14]KKR54741.1 MAG: HNH nuclease [Parcubacteria group bacterium GW2011_GWA2_40_23]
MYTKERWSNQTILAVWEKVQPVSGYDSNKYRRDACGAWMEFDKHGDRDAVRGWEIDHRKPEAHGGGDELSNLQPLHWKNNVEKGDSSQLRCAFRS